MKFAAVIPARYAASRFPGKLLQQLGNRSVIAHTYQNTLATGLFDEVAVVTDSDLIEEEIKKINGRVLRSTKEHLSGTDRIAEVASQFSSGVLINVQGDEPFVQKEPLEKICSLFTIPGVRVASLMHQFSNQEEAADPNTVKVVVNLKMEAMYFSRSSIPFLRDTDAPVTYYKHIGVYGYTREALKYITELPPSALELTEKLEQLRILENGIPIKMAECDPWSISIDTPADLEKARRYILSRS